MPRNLNLFSLGTNKPKSYKIVDENGKIIIHLGKQQFFRMKATADLVLIKLKKYLKDDGLKVERI